MPGNLSEHALEIPYYFLILESQHPDTGTFQIRVARPVVKLPGVVVVCRAVKLDSELLRHAIEIEHVGSGPMLTAKLPAGELPSLKVFPQRRFCGRQLFA